MLWRREMNEREKREKWTGKKEKGMKKKINEWRKREMTKNNEKDTVKWKNRVEYEMENDDEKNKLKRNKKMKWKGEIEKKRTGKKCMGKKKLLE